MSVKKISDIRVGHAASFAELSDLAKTARDCCVDGLSSHYSPFEADELGVFRDELGNEFQDPRIYQRTLAIQSHGNDPHVRLDLCNIPRHRRAFMLSYDYKTVLKKTGFKGGWDWQFLVGPEGTGKTTLACRQAWEWMTQDPTRKVSFVSIADWVEDIKGNGDSGEKANLDLPKLRSFIILDDFDKSYHTDWQILQIFRLINHLYRTDKHVIITSNRTFEMILKELGNKRNVRTYLDRIRERAKNATLSLNWESHRK